MKYVEPWRRSRVAWRAHAEKRGWITNEVEVERRVRAIAREEGLDVQDVTFIAQLGAPWELGGVVECALSELRGGYALRIATAVRWEVVLVDFRALARRAVRVGLPRVRP